MEDGREEVELRKRKKKRKEEEEERRKEKKGKEVDSRYLTVWLVPRVHKQRVRCLGTGLAWGERKRGKPGATRYSTSREEEGDWGYGGGGGCEGDKRKEHARELISQLATCTLAITSGGIVL